VQLYLDARSLGAVAAANRQRYAEGQPFPHIVLDGILPAPMLDLALSEFPDVDSRVWREFDN